MDSGFSFSAFIGGLGGALVAAFAVWWQSWIGAHAKIDEGLREMRRVAYKVLWERTGLVPKYPKASDVTYGKLVGLSEAMRDWYFASGGMYLTAEARSAYGESQKLIQSLTEGKTLDAVVSPDDYDRLQERFSALRTELTVDLLSRERSTLWRLPGFGKA